MRNTRWLINPTWRCQHSCSYCWMRNTVGTRPELYRAPERPFEDWVAAIRREIPDSVDIAGGEPLLLDWLPDLIAALPRQKFALSTNGMVLPAVERLAKMRLPNLFAINVSYHPESRLEPYDLRHYRAVKSLTDAGYAVQVNVVAYGDNAERSAVAIERYRRAGVHVAVSPYEHSGDLGTLTETPLACKAGVNHMVIAPDGSAWPCLTTLRSPYWKRYRLGNWLDGEVDLARVEQPCKLACHDVQLAREHESGDMWNVQARPA